VANRVPRHERNDSAKVVNMLLHRSSTMTRSYSARGTRISVTGGKGAQTGAASDNPAGQDAPCGKTEPDPGLPVEIAIMNQTRAAYIDQPARSREPR